MISETSQKGSYYVKVSIAKVSIGTSEISPLTYRYQKTTPLVERQVLRDALERTLIRGGGGGGRGGEGGCCLRTCIYILKPKNKRNINIKKKYNNIIYNIK